eukprot:CAMPEP_0176131716 /NCGR_PEP_ID=MMETSP0120_2-20121206/66692_1 /TAXON_ID=160619 /ORGANISM="Kryptoperidinium foliaceum, Strain CCMP 1326" /LENGTH=172 /DNA_ID=CAMNT_0017467117 /DNA_START=17 /DNA_END=532 /DNA_ORIENTATION=+
MTRQSSRRLRSARTPEPRAANAITTIAASRAKPEILQPALSNNHSTLKHTAAPPPMPNTRPSTRATPWLGVTARTPPPGTAPAWRARSQSPAETALPLPETKPGLGATEGVEKRRERTPCGVVAPAQAAHYIAEDIALTASTPTGVSRQVLFAERVDLSVGAEELDDDCAMA